MNYGSIDSHALRDTTSPAPGFNHDLQTESATPANSKRRLPNIWPRRRPKLPAGASPKRSKRVVTRESAWQHWSFTGNTGMRYGPPSRATAPGKESLWKEEVVLLAADLGALGSLDVAIPQTANSDRTGDQGNLVKRQAVVGKPRRGGYADPLALVLHTTDA